MYWETTAKIKEMYLKQGLSPKEVEKRFLEVYQRAAQEQRSLELSMAA